MLNENLKEDMKETVIDYAIKHIKDFDIRSFTVDIIEKLPDYIWHVPASSTGRYHPKSELGEGGLSRHLLNVAEASSILCDLRNVVGKSRDLIIASMIVHDGLKSGSAEQFRANKHTKFAHPMMMANLIRVSRGLNVADKREMANIVASHSGPWTTTTLEYGANCVLPLPLTENELIGHLADFIASRKEVEQNNKGRGLVLACMDHPLFEYMDKKWQKDFTCAAEQYYQQYNDQQ